MSEIKKYYYYIIIITEIDDKNTIAKKKMVKRCHFKSVDNFKYIFLCFIYKIECMALDTIL